MRKAKTRQPSHPCKISIISYTLSNWDHSTFRALILIFVAICMAGRVASQTNRLQAKIDPLLRALIKQQSSSTPERTVHPSPFQIQPKPKKDLPGVRTVDRYECIVYTGRADLLRDRGIIVNSVFPSFATALVTLEEIKQLSLIPEIKYIKAPDISYPTNDVVVGSSGASLLQQGRLNNTAYKGKNVLIGIYDTGIDWKHYDFRDPSNPAKSRIVRMWDQSTFSSDGAPVGFSYGSEYTQERINDELDGTPANTIEENDSYGHGTHVAGTAAGNGAAFPGRLYAGMAPEAEIVVVKGGDDSFSEDKIIDGLTFFDKVATEMGKPIVVNMSLGSQYGAHDGSQAYEKAIDDFTKGSKGRVVVVSAGNDNGFNIHNTLTIAGGKKDSISFAVPTTSSLSTAFGVFEYYAYLNNSDTVSTILTAPTGEKVTVNTEHDTSVLVINNAYEVYLFNGVDPVSSKTYIHVYISRTFEDSKTQPNGTWKLSITNPATTSLTLHGWLTYVDSRFSTTSLMGGNNDFIIGSPGNAASAITVASYVGKTNWYSGKQFNAYTRPIARQDSISTFSSRGPRVDGLLKPEIASVGEVVISCLSADAAPRFASSSIVEDGLYVKNQGTSMAAPGVTGAVALLLQANPTATASAIKSMLTSATDKDVDTRFPGPVPNSTWGYGKLDVYKAVAQFFNCDPVERKLYRYDSSTRPLQEIHTDFSSESIAVEFTPEISGKLGGLFFHTYVETTGLLIEVRAKNRTQPGALLGSLNIEGDRIAKATFNYADLSELNISVTASSNYFVVLKRALSSREKWSLLGEDLSNAGRTFELPERGLIWNASNINYKIRTIVYSNVQLAGKIATINSADERNLNSSTQFINQLCQLIGQVLPFGANPISGTVASKVWVESGVPHYAGAPYVQRHYELLPNNHATASGRVTLYFTQDEFTAFNNDAASVINLPTGPNDAIGKAALRIGRYLGTSSDNSGLIGTYGGSKSVIDPVDADIVFNATANRWEVTFNTTGFGGFAVQTSLTVLPLVQEYFRGNTQSGANILNWKFNCSASATFQVERSKDGTDFTAIGSITANQRDCSKSFSFRDEAPYPEQNYYRIKVYENSGGIVYTGILLLQNDRFTATRLYPTIIASGGNLQVSFASETGHLYVYDATGRLAFTKSLIKGTQSITVNSVSKGLYFFTIKNGKATTTSGKLIIE